MENKHLLPSLSEHKVVSHDSSAPAEHAAAIKMLGKRVFSDVIEIGWRLSKCRTLLKEEGGWRAWLKAEFVWDRKTASNFIHLFELSQSEGERVLPSNLPLRSLYLLAAPSTPESVRDAVLDRVAAGEPLTHAQVTQVIAEAKGRKPPAKRKPAIEQQVRDYKALCNKTAAIETAQAALGKKPPPVSDEVLEQRDAAAERIHTLMGNTKPDSASETAPKTHIEELEAQLKHFAGQNTSHRSEIRELKAALANKLAGVSNEQLFSELEHRLSPQFLRTHQAAMKAIARALETTERHVGPTLELKATDSEVTKH